MNDVAVEVGTGATVAGRGSGIDVAVGTRFKTVKGVGVGKGDGTIVGVPASTGLGISVADASAVGSVSRLLGEIPQATISRESALTTETARRINFLLPWSPVVPGLAISWRHLPEP